MTAEASQDALSLTQFFQLLAASVWSKIEFAHKVRGLKVNEIAITQDIAYHFFLFAKNRQLPIRLFESNSEKTNGNDLEILVELNEGIIKMPCQAKLINKAGRYKQLNYSRNGRFQIDLLLSYAERVNGFPIYLFYNYYDRGDINRLEELLGPQKEVWGCSIGSAGTLKKVFFNEKVFRAPSFYDLHDNICKPLCLLSEILGSPDEVASLGNLFGAGGFERIKLFSKDEILSDYHWVDMTPQGNLGLIPEKHSRLLAGETQTKDGFLPKFRISN